MHGYHTNIESLVLNNQNFRQVLYTAPHSQLVAMSLKPSEDIGLEMHTVDQFFRFEKGHGKAVIDDQEYEVNDGDVVIVPAGAHHNIINLSDTEDLKLYTIYSPANHRDGVVHATKEAAEADHESFDGKTTE